MKILDWTNSVTKALQTLLTQAPPLKCENVGLTLSLPCEVADIYDLCIFMI